MTFTGVGGVTLHYRLDRGPNGSPLLTFVNSLGCDLRIWDGVVPFLNDDFSILRYDIRGHGLSDLGKPPYALDDHVRDLCRLILSFPAEKRFLCGLSIGGQIAMGAQLAYPDLFAGLILSNTAAKIGTRKRYEQRVSLIKDGGFTEFAQSQMKRWFSHEFRERSSEVVAGMFSMLTRQDREGYCGSCETLAATDLTPRLKNLSCPILCLAGERDSSTPPRNR